MATFTEITLRDSENEAVDLGMPPLPVFEAARQRPDATWLLRDASGEVAGRCSLWWRDTARHQGRRVGVIGHYAARDVPSGVRLLERACAELRERDCRAVFGPMDGNTWQNYRLVVESSVEPPFFMEPSHPADWPDHFREAGFTEAARYYSALCTDLAHTDAGLAELAGRLARLDIRVRSVRLDELEAELREIHQLTVASFGHSFLFTPIPREDFAAQYRRLQPLVVPELVQIAEQRGQMIGYVFALPDVLRRQGDTIVLKTLAVHPEHRSTGVGRLLAGLCHRKAHELGYTRAIHALMPDDGAARGLSEIIAAPIRRYALFHRALGAVG